MTRAFLQNLSATLEDRQNRFLRDFWHARPGNSSSRSAGNFLKKGLKFATVTAAITGTIGAFGFGLPILLTTAGTFAGLLTLATAICITGVLRAEPGKYLFFGDRERIEGDKKDLMLVQRTKDVVNDMARAQWAEITGGHDEVPEDDRDKLKKRLSFYFNDVKAAAGRIRVMNDQKEYVDDFDLGVGTSVFPIALTRLQTRDGLEKKEAKETEALREKAIAQAGTVQVDIDMPPVIAIKRIKMTL
jgi:hypothetical protein